MAKLLEEAISGPGPFQTLPVFFKGQRSQLPVVQCSTEYLAYRLTNGRTDIQQGQYIHEHALSSSFFADQESEEAQLAQHDILVKMADEQGLADDMIKRKQMEPLIVSKQGVVVNGNRRLAIAREQGTPYMTVAVLPQGDEKDFDLLETELQISEDFKAPYNWVNELKKVRKLNQVHGLTLSQIKDVMRLKSAQEVSTTLEMLDLIDLYLERVGAPGDYYLVGSENKRQAFQTTAERHKVIKDPAKAEAFRNRAFTLIEHPPDQGRLYGHLSDLAKCLEDIMTDEAALGQGNGGSSDDHQLAGDAGAPAPDTSAGLTAIGEIDDPLSGVEDADGGIPSIEQAYRTSAGSPERAAGLVEIIQRVKEKNQEQHDLGLAHKKISEALLRLSEARPEPDSLHLPQLLELLDKISQEVAVLEIKVARLLAKE